MADSVADKHTDGNRNYDGSYKLHGIKKVGARTHHSLESGKMKNRSLTNGGLGSYFFYQ